MFSTFNRCLGTRLPSRSVSPGRQRLCGATGRVAQDLHGLPAALSSGTLGRGSHGWPSLRLAPRHLEGKQVNSVPHLGLLFFMGCRRAGRKDSSFSSNGVFASGTISEGRTGP